MSRGAPSIAVVIPALDDAAALPDALASCAALGPCQIVVVDGGSADGTPAMARAHGAAVVRAAPGRGPQCNAGAAATRAPLLLFLHADARLPAMAGARVRAACARPGVVGGFFRLRLDAPGAVYRFIDACAWIRSACGGQPAGDQALFCTRAAFEAAGGFPPVPLFEDLEFARRLRRVGRLVAVREPVVASAVAYRREGPWRRCARNVALRWAHARGVPHVELAARYARRRGRRPAPDEVVLLLARAPQRGHVKTRLAAALGADAALAAHTALGGAVARRLAPALGPARAGVAAVTPPDALEAAAAWLGPPWRVVPQGEGDLGARLAAATDGAFASGARRVLCVGGDCAEVTPADVESACAALATHDAVLGPAADGGYWALGLARPAPGLFTGIDWGTARVAAQTRAAARSAGLRLAELRTLADVDRIEDLRALVERLGAGDADDRALAHALAALLGPAGGP